MYGEPGEVEEPEWANEEERTAVWTICADVMAVGDQHTRNCQLTVNEIKTYLSTHVKWAGFSAWLTGEKRKESGRFKVFGARVREIFICQPDTNFNPDPHPDASS